MASTLYSAPPARGRSSPSGPPGLGQLVAAASIASTSPPGAAKLNQHSLRSSPGQAGGSTAAGGATGASEVAAAVKGRQTKPGAKRGRKRIEESQTKDEEHDELEGDPKRNRQTSPDANEKRKIQNRAAQRAFRERKEQHVLNLEKAVVEQGAQLVHYWDLIQNLYAETLALRRGEIVPVAMSELPLPPTVAPTFNADSHTPTPPPPQPTLTSAAEPKAVKAELTSLESSAFGLPVVEPVKAEFGAPGYTFDDFDAPFDLESVVPLPPLFNDLFNQSFPPLDTCTEPFSVGTPTGSDDRAHQAKREAEEDEDLCPIDEPAPLPLGRLPCDKPECDFSTLSCALPIPWRPKQLPDEVKSKDVWVAQVAWAKLVSHPMFSQCDVDELCHELRDRARCSEDGRVVISKMEACDVFRSIPQRARANRDRMEV